jgi:hypothetical protein
MRNFLMLSVLVLYTSCLLPAQSSNKLYKLPQTSSAAAVSPSVIAGVESGLYRITSTRTAVPLWTGGKVSHMVRTELTDASGTMYERWFFVTSAGILTTTDFGSFEFRNSGLPFLTIKKYDGTNTTFEQQPAQLKDLAVNPSDPNMLVTATKDNVFITYDAGVSWSSIGSMSSGTSGIKAVAVATIDGEVVVFMSHPIFGFSYSIPQSKNHQWHDVTSGFEPLPTQTYPDEIGDILPVIRKNADGTAVTEIYVSQTFIPRIYRFDWTLKKAEKVFVGTEPADTIDGLYWNGSEIVYAKPGTVCTFNPDTLASGAAPASFSSWKDSFNVLAPKDTLYTAWIPPAAGDSNGLMLSELWMLKPESCTGSYAEKADNRKAVYVPANHVCSQDGIDSFKKLIKSNSLNALVIDMKDDYGLLRYNAKDPLVVEKGFQSRYSIDLEHFVSEFKKDNVYLIARIVVFKDKNLSQYGGGKYAVWDKGTNKPWIGQKGMADVKDPQTGVVTGQAMQYYDENWVDPYSPEVWEYNIAIARELIARGFDEIQFDYIRFPTDGLNMNKAQFRWQTKGMDKESALISFLSYARRNIDAPIGIDIYGANGWYRSGARTGQDIELLSQYVDVVSPMFYPSHFEQEFLNYAPFSERPYRVYFYGTYRATVIGRNKVIIRPWVQAFYLGVSYDRQFYDKNYVQKEIFGVRDSVNRGYMYWNNIGRYDDVSPDIGTAPYPWTASEANTKYRKPALSSGDAETQPSLSGTTIEPGARAGDSKGDTVSALDSIRAQEVEKGSLWPSVKKVRLLWQAYSKDGA